MPIPIDEGDRDAAAAWPERKNQGHEGHEPVQETHEAGKSTDFAEG
jgi:hypothetical protein